MGLVSDGLLIAGALAAAFYCFVLARRVRSLGDLDKGLGSAIASLSHRVGELQVALESAKSAAAAAQSETDAAADRAERAANRLQLLLAATQLDEPRAQGRGAPADEFQFAPRSETPDKAPPRAPGPARHMPRPSELA
ncbi:MAG: hypothetical protein ACE5FS_13465 [Paracoccaceae bacterium]